jgi:hypothetical protein
MSLLPIAASCAPAEISDLIQFSAISVVSKLVLRIGRCDYFVLLGYINYIPKFARILFS